jgi:CDGSH-type Zn-finger protein/uncharacterized Fe-S cluster protein YjdI
MARRLQTYTNETLTVTFAPDRCIHAAVCVRRLPRVFAPRERPWIRLEHGEAQAIADAVAGCPTGALQLRWADGAVPVAPADGAGESEPTAALLIQLQRDGPLLVRGPVRLVHGDTGEVIAVDDRVALCRCGGTRNPPFCDGTHSRIGFRSASVEAPDPSVG